MSRLSLWFIAAVAALTLFWLVIMAANFNPSSRVTTVEMPPPPPPPETRTLTEFPRQVRDVEPSEPPPVAAAPVLVPPPVEVVPPPEPEPDPSQGNLPPLNRSDDFVLGELRGMNGGAAVIRFLAPERLIRRFVVFVHNVSGGELPVTELPYRRIGGQMPVRTVDENLYELGPPAHRRFNRMVNAFVALNPDQVMALYRYLSPLFDNAYAEIGFSRGTFDITLRRAIARVLEASPPEGPIRLVKPSVVYVYADSSIEDMSAVEKQLIRLGPENTAKLKERLQEFHDRL